MNKMTFKTALLIPAMMAFVFACSNNPGTTESAATGEPTPGVAPDTLASPVVTREYKTKTGKVITVAESHPQGQSLSNISVAFAGDAASEMKFTDVDPINKVLVGDLDGNGFDEIYIITISAGSGSYGNVIGVGSNSDKSLSLVFIPPVEEKDLDKGGKFTGYEGHDEFEITGNSLVRTFPVKAAKPTKRAIHYQMKAGEAGYLLFIKTSADL
jgi:hypothetical protein